LSLWFKTPGRCRRCWALDTAIASEEGLLIIRPEGADSQARLYFFLDESLYYAIFEVRVVNPPDGLVRETGSVELEFECVGGEQPCAELDFTLMCPYEMDKMGQCTTPIDSAWTGYPFSWTRCRSGDCPKPPN